MAASSIFAALPGGTSRYGGLGDRNLLKWEDAAAGAELPHARGGAATAVWRFASQEVLYLFGGCSEVSCFDDMQRHDQRSMRWAEQSARGKAPTRRKGHTMTLLGPAWAQQLLVFGGWGGDGPVTNSLKAFALATASWEVLSIAGTPPPARWAHSTTAIDASRMLVIGGEGVLPGQYFNDVTMFNLDEQQWSRMHPTGDGSSGRLIPSARMGHTATLIGEAVLVFGGYVNELRGSRHHRVASNELWALDLKGGVSSRRSGSVEADGMRWVKVPTIGQAPAARGFHTAVAGGTNLFIAFGCDEVEAACFNDAYMLDTTCERRPMLPFPIPSPSAPSAPSAFPLHSRARAPPRAAEPASAFILPPPFFSSA